MTFDTLDKVIDHPGLSRPKANMPEQITRAVQDYLKAIHSLGGAEKIVSPMDLSNKLSVRSASVTGMLRRLARDGWVEYQVSRGARLTDRGITEARRVIRRHRLMELFLTRVLGLDWSEVDEEAELLEHAISPRLEQAIAKHLGEPLEDPHGHPIPSREGKIRQRDLKPLHEFPPGVRAIIREVHDQHPGRLRRWSDLGLLPGSLVNIVRHHPLDGTFEIQVGEKTITLGAEGIAGLLAEPSGVQKGSARKTPKAGK